MTDHRQDLFLECFEEATGFLTWTTKLDEFGLKPEAAKIVRRLESGCGEIELNAEEEKVVLDGLGQHMNTNGVFFILRYSTEVDALPYVVHTNREFDLMLRGVKPLSVFEDYLGAAEDRLEAIQKKFMTCSQSQRFVQRRYTRLSSGPDKKRDAISVLLIARESEEWRIDAYILMMDCSDKAGWNLSFERLQGALLGYESWQIDIFLENLRHKKVQGN